MTIMLIGQVNLLFFLHFLLNSSRPLGAIYSTLDEVNTDQIHYSVVIFVSIQLPTIITEHLFEEGHSIIGSIFFIVKCWNHFRPFFVLMSFQVPIFINFMARCFPSDRVIEVT